MVFYQVLQCTAFVHCKNSLMCNYCLIVEGSTVYHERREGQSESSELFVIRSTMPHRQRASSEKSSLHLIRPSAFLASASLLACITSTAPGAARCTAANFISQRLCTCCAQDRWRAG